MAVITSEECAKAWEEAYAAGMDAGTNARPTPMVVGKTDSQGNLVDIVEVVDDGICGFAWVKIAGTTPFARWAKKNGISQKSLTGGHIIHCGEFEQSLERKVAWATAVANHLTHKGIMAFVCQHID